MPTRKMASYRLPLGAVARIDALAAALQRRSPGKVSRADAIAWAVDRALAELGEPAPEPGHPTRTDTSRARRAVRVAKEAEAEVEAEAEPEATQAQAQAQARPEEVDGMALAGRLVAAVLAGRRKPRLPTPG